MRFNYFSLIFILHVKIISLFHSTTSADAPIANSEIGDPVNRLVGSSDYHVQGGAALAIATFASPSYSSSSSVNPTAREVNLRQLREGGVFAALLPLLTSRSIAVQSHAAGAVTALTSLPSTSAGLSASVVPATTSVESTAAFASTTTATTTTTTTSELTLALNHLLTLGLVPSLLELLRPPHVDDAALTNNVVGSLLNVSHFANGTSFALTS